MTTLLSDPHLSMDSRVDDFRVYNDPSKERSSHLVTVCRLPELPSFRCVNLSSTLDAFIDLVMFSVVVHPPETRNRPMATVESSTHQTVLLFVVVVAIIVASHDVPTSSGY